MPGLASDWGLWSMKNRQQLGIQEESKSSCCYSCSRKATAQIATSDSYMKTEITFFTDFFPLWFQQNFFHHSRACHSLVHDASGQHGVSSLDATVSKHWSNWKGYCRLPQFLPFTFSITGTKQQISLRNILWEPSENGGSGLLMCPAFPMAEGAMVFLREAEMLNTRWSMGSPDKEEISHPRCHYGPLMRNMQLQSSRPVLPLTCRRHYFQMTTCCTLVTLWISVSNPAAPISLFRSEHNDFGLRLLNNLEKNRSNRMQSSE